MYSQPRRRWSLGLWAALASSCVRNHDSSGHPAGSAGDGGSATTRDAAIREGSPDAKADGATRGSLPFLRDYTDRAAPPFVDGSSPPSQSGPPVAITVDSGQISRPLPRTLWGNNSAVWNGANLTSPTTVQRLSGAGVSILRFPGGSTSDQYHFDGQYPPYAQAQGWSNWSQSWTVNTAQYMQLVRQLGAIPLITANYGYATYDTTAQGGNVANAARLAADWVEYCNAPNDGSNPNGGTDWAAKRDADGSPSPYAVQYWEIGNEVFGSWETGYDPNGATYAANFNTIADVMKKVDPTISIGLVVDPSPAGQSWTRTVLANPGTVERADFLIAHTYFTQFASADEATPQRLLAMAHQVADLKASLDEHLTAFTTRTPADLPYYLGEYNVPGPTNALQISLASAMFIAKVLGAIASSGWAAASIWDVINGYDTPGTYGAGDHGFLATNQPGVPSLAPRPTYYPFYFFSHNFGDHLIASTSADSQVTVTASRFTGGSVGIVIVNEAAEARSVSLSIAGAATSGHANLWILTGPSAEGALVSLNGVVSGAPAGGPSIDAVKPYVVSVGTRGSAGFDLPPSSVASLVVY